MNQERLCAKTTEKLSHKKSTATALIYCSLQETVQSTIEVRMKPRLLGLEDVALTLDHHWRRSSQLTTQLSGDVPTSLPCATFQHTAEWHFIL